MKKTFTTRHIPLAWLQLKREKGRLLVAMAGIAFADMLMFIQLGFQTALYESNTRLHRSLNADLVLISPQGRNIINLNTFPRRRLYQTLSFDGVVSAEPFYTEIIDWKNPQTQLKKPMLLIGFSPTYLAINLLEIKQNLEKLKYPDVILFDRGSHGEYEKTIHLLEQGKSISTEIRNRKLTVVGLFQSGASFAADGYLITSDLNFHRIITNRDPSEVSAGLIKLRPEIDAQQMARILQTHLPGDVRVLTKAEFVQFEENYWAKTTAIGFIFTLGTIIGFIVGVVIVYQILSSDVSDHIAEYATLKAMGYRNSYLLIVVLQEALILAILGFLPGSAIAFGLYALTRNATSLPIYMTMSRAITVFILTMMMCIISGGIATKKLRAADPADIF
jgi:putative ABC transport system permease protein